MHDSFSNDNKEEIFSSMSNMEINEIFLREALLKEERAKIDFDRRKFYAEYTQDPNMLLSIAQSYEKGIGTPVSIKQSLFYYKKAAVQSRKRLIEDHDEDEDEKDKISLLFHNTSINKKKGSFSIEKNSSSSPKAILKKKRNERIDAGGIELKRYVSFAEEKGNQYHYYKLEDGEENETRAMEIEREEEEERLVYLNGFKFGLMAAFCTFISIFCFGYLILIALF